MLRITVLWIHKIDAICKTKKYIKNYFSFLLLYFCIILDNISIYNINVVTGESTICWIVHLAMALWPTQIGAGKSAQTRGKREIWLQYPIGVHSTCLNNGRWFLVHTTKRYMAYTPIFINLFGTKKLHALEYKVSKTLIQICSKYELLKLNNQQWSGKWCI